MVLEASGGDGGGGCMEWNEVEWDGVRWEGRCDTFQRSAESLIGLQRPSSLRTSGCGVLYESRLVWLAEWRIETCASFIYFVGNESGDGGNAAAGGQYLT